MQILEFPTFYWWTRLQVDRIGRLWSLSSFSLGWDHVDWAAQLDDESRDSLTLAIDLTMILADN